MTYEYFSTEFDARLAVAEHKANGRCAYWMQDSVVQWQVRSWA